MIIRFAFLLLNCAFLQTLDIEPVVILTDVSGGHTVIGQKLILECKTTFYLDYISVQWDKSGDTVGVEEKPVINRNKNSTYLTIAKLTIREASLNPSGMYRCKVVHIQWNYTCSDELWIPVYKPDEHFIEFANNYFVNIFDVPEARIQFYLKVHPNVSLFWVKDGKNIDMYNSSRYSIEAGFCSNHKEFNFCATLQFKHISEEDFGFYTLVAQNKFGTKSQEVEVTLSEFDKPSLSIEYISEDRKYVRWYVCKAVSQKPEVNWILAPCCNNVCDKYQVKT